jgi:FixJ family two-component response regulator
VRQQIALSQRYRRQADPLSFPKHGIRIGCPKYVQMPELNGHEVQPRLAGRGLPIISITARDDIGVREQVLAASAVAYSRMPLHNELL